MVFFSRRRSARSFSTRHSAIDIGCSTFNVHHNQQTANFNVPLTQLLTVLMSTTPNLSSFSTCEISDALIKLGLPHGGHIPDIHMVSPSSDTRICAQAYTVQMVLTSDTSAPKLTSHFVDTAPEGCIIVIDVPPRLVLFFILAFFSIIH